MQNFDAKEFVKEQVSELRGAIGNERAVIAISGGVDSTTCAALTYRALGENLLCVMLDDAFMRAGEPERVRQLLSNSPLNLPVKILRVQERFLKALGGLKDAEEKRKKFRETFYETLGETAKREGCRFLVQGTIKADIDETTGGIKTQHNVLSQMGISPDEHYGFRVIEPLASLYKPQVRRVARLLDIPSEISERQPFPGPGLSVRAVGEIRSDKLKSLKRATATTEEKLAQHQPQQYFAVIIDNEEGPYPPKLSRKRIESTVANSLKIPIKRASVRVLRDRATGIRDGRRHYGKVAAVEAQRSDGSLHQFPVEDLVSLQETMIAEYPILTRVLNMIEKKDEKQPYMIAIRAIQTHNFLTAEVADVPWPTLTEIAKEILGRCVNVSAVYYDVTPKPPATIEME